MTDSDFQPVTASIEFDTSNAIASAQALIRAASNLDDSLSQVKELTNSLQSSFEDAFRSSGIVDFGNDVDSVTQKLRDLFQNEIISPLDDIDVALDKVVKSVDVMKDAFEGVGESIKADSDYLNQLDAIANATAMAKNQTPGSVIPTSREIEGKYGLNPVDNYNVPPDANSDNPDDTGGGESALSAIGGRGFSTAGSLGRDLGLGDIGKAVADVGKVITTARLAERLLDLAGGLDDILAVVLPLTAAVIAGSLAWNELQSEVKSANQALEEAKSSIDAYYNAIATGTTESIQKQLNDLEAQKAEADKKAEDIQTALNNGFSGAQAQFGDLGARLITAGESAGAFGGGVKDVTSDMEDAKKKSNELQGQIDGLTLALNSGNIALNNFQSTLQKSISWEIQRDDLIRTASGKQVEDLIAKNEIEQKVYQEAIDKEVAKYNELQASGNLTADAIANIAQKEDEYKGKLADLQTQYTDLSGVVLTVAENNDKLKDSFKDLSTLIDNTAKETQDVNSNSQKQSADQLSADDKYYTAANDAYVAYHQQRDDKESAFNDAVKDADDKQAQKQIDGKNKLTDQINAIQTKADDEVAKLKTDQSTKEQKMADDLATKKQEIEANLSDKIQSIAIDLANKIADIKNKANQDEIDAAYNLDARKIADIQRKEATDIENAEKDSSRKEDVAKKDEQKQIDAAQATYDKQKAVLEKDNELKIQQIEAQASKEESLKLAQGTQALAIQQTQYDVERTQKIDDFNKKIAEEDDRNKTLAKQRYDAWIAEKDAIDKKYDDQKTAIEKKYDDQNDAIKAKLDTINGVVGGKLNDQATLFGNHFGTLITTQTTKQFEIESSWSAMLDKLKSNIEDAAVPGSHATSSSPTSPAYNSPFSSSPTSPISYANLGDLGNIQYGGTPNNNLTNDQLNQLIGKTYGVDPSTGLPTTNSPRTGDLTNFAGYNGQDTELGTVSNSSNGSDSLNGIIGGIFSGLFGGSIPGFASGLDRVPRDNFIASLHADEMVLNKKAADDYRSSSGSSGHSINISDGAITINGTNLSKEELKDAMIEALSDKIKEFVGS